MFKRSLDSLLAIDLAPECVRVLDVSLRRGVPSIQAVASDTLPEGGPDTLPERQLGVLEKILESHRLRTRNCVAAMPTNLVTTRSVMIDPAKPQPPEEQIRLTLQNILTYDSKDLLFDYWDVTASNEKSRTYEVLVVAAQRTIVHRYLEGFKRLKLSCTHLDVAPCALASLITKLLPEQEAMVGTVALGETLGYFAVVQKNKVLFWRPFEMPPAKNGPQSVLERIGDEVSKCVSHMVGSQHLDNLNEVILFGRSAHDPAFAGYLTTRFNLQVKTPSPLESLAATTLSDQARTALEPATATHFAAALGLALQGAGGNHG